MIKPGTQHALNSEIAVIRTRFLEDMKERLNGLNDLRAQIADRKNAPTALDQIGKHAHKMAGVAETLGFPKLGVLASQVDSEIRSALSGDLTNEQIDVLACDVNALLEHLETLSLTRQEK